MADHAHDHDHSHDAAYVPGSMDIREKEKTFETFIRMVCWGAGISIAVLIFLALIDG